MIRRASLPAGRGWGRGFGLSCKRRKPPPDLPLEGEGQLHPFIAA